MTTDTILRQANIKLPPGAIAPDEYDPRWGADIPADFVVSRNRDGTPLSRYGMACWDRTPYDAHHEEGRLYFNEWEGEGATTSQLQLMDEMRWIIFLMIWVKHGPALGNVTLIKYVNALRAAARHCDKRHIRIQDLLSDPDGLLQAWPGHLLANVLSIVSHLRQMGPEVVGFTVMRTNDMGAIVEAAREWSDGLKQHPPIPVRLYSIILSNLDKEMSEIERILDRLLGLAEECFSDRLAGLAYTNQSNLRRELGVKYDYMRPDFKTLVAKYGLNEFWGTRAYDPSRMGLGTALSEVQAALCLQIQAWGGMRGKEGRTLPYSCSYQEVHAGKTHFFVKGKTTKMAKSKVKRTEWVTSIEGKAAIDIAQRISKVIYSAFDRVPGGESGEINDFLLFPSASSVAIRRQKVSAAAIELYIFPRLRVLVGPIIEQGDIDELVRIDPLREWQDEPQFEVGKPWRLTSHQLRRSLALYARANGVSFPTMKRQLQHITEAMTRYYAKGSASAKRMTAGQKDHIGLEWQQAGPVAMFLQYMDEVLEGDRSDLIGPHAKFAKTRLVDENGIWLVSRTVLEERFKRGEMSYESTPVGGCVNPNPCHRSPFRVITGECVREMCEHGVISEKKVVRLIKIEADSVAKMKRKGGNLPEISQKEKDLQELQQGYEAFSKAART